MGLYSNALETTPANLFYALTGYLDYISKRVSVSQLSVPVKTHSHQNLAGFSAEDVMLSRDDKVLAGVRIVVEPSEVGFELTRVNLSPKELEELTTIRETDSMEARLGKATQPTFREVRTPTYTEAKWTIYLRVPGKPLRIFSGSPFEEPEMEKAFMAILDEIKP